MPARQALHRGVTSAAFQACVLILRGRVPEASMRCVASDAQGVAASTCCCSVTSRQTVTWPAVLNVYCLAAGVAVKKSLEMFLRKPKT